jgi:hypothetical protein
MPDDADEQRTVPTLAIASDSIEKRARKARKKQNTKKGRKPVARYRFRHRQVQRGLRIHRTGTCKKQHSSTVGSLVSSFSGLCLLSIAKILTIQNCCVLRYFPLSTLLQLQLSRAAGREHGSLKTTEF